ncbi:MAG TPA: glycosyltransferase family 4 protein [Sphingobacterium bovisgrunnientis]|nr:glycosyltransferase family 4 protein [Sphingobacterium bovisgrunnientis]
MSSKGFKVLGVSSDGRELQNVREQEKVDVVELEMTRTISPIKDLKSLYRFYRLCKREKPTIVHSHTPKAGIVGMLGAKLAGVPIRLHTVAGMPLMEARGIRRTILDFVEKVTYAAATRVYPNSKGLYDFILKEGYTSRNKLKVIGNGSSNGVDTNFFDKGEIPIGMQNSLKEKLKIFSEDFVFIFVGRLVGDKGLNELVTAFKKLANSKMKLLLVGALESDLDPLKPHTLQEIEDNPSIISVGFQKDVRPYFAVSDALVFPSYREGFPNVVMQAGAMELPCIVSNINGCNEIIIEGENGTIIPVKNSEAIYNAMEKFVNDEHYYERLKKRSREMIQNRYEQQVVWDALLEEYRMLLKEKGLS